MHDKSCFKYFNFSNIFPINGFKKDETYNLLISSPDKNLVRELYSIFKEDLDSIKNIGILKIKLQDVKIFNKKLSFPWMTATPIVLKKCKRVYLSNGKTILFLDIKNLNILEYLGFEKSKQKIDFNNMNKIKIDLNTLKNIDPRFFKIIKIDDRYYSFNQGDNLLDWLDSLKKNSILKYNNFFNTDFELEEPIFEELKFRKEVVVEPKIKNKGKAIIIGLDWKKLSISRTLDKEEKRFYQFLFDCGLGILNSMGFGFVNTGQTNK